MLAKGNFGFAKAVAGFGCCSIVFANPSAGFGKSKSGFGRRRAVFAKAQADQRGSDAALHRRRPLQANDASRHARTKKPPEGGLLGKQCVAVATGGGSRQRRGGIAAALGPTRACRLPVNSLHP